MKTKNVLILLLAALLLAACGGGDGGSNAADGGDTAEEANEAGAGGGGTEVTVTAANFAFSPAKLSLEPGEEVSLTFVNDDSAPHTFTSEDLGVDLSAGAGEDATGSFTAPDSGSVEWQCTIHPAMTGTITVGGGSAQGGDDDKEKKDKKSGDDSGGVYDY
ncbi:MAG: cupredoxin domain-containing protein [Actinomycetota bacterium]